MARLIKNLIAEESGATMVEYVLLVTFIGIALVTVLGVLAGSLNSRFTSVAGQLTAAS